MIKKPTKNFVVIFLLGIASGLPIVLILSTLKALLTDQGFDLRTIGFFSLVSIPYSLKFLFAPFIDSCSIPFLKIFFGRRKSWIVLTQIFLIIFIFLLGFFSKTGDILVISIFALLVAFASASQDVVIDAYRIELIEKNNQALAASFYIYGYRVGMLVSGALALVVAEKFNWQIAYFLMSIVMLFLMLTTFFADEEKNVKPHQKGNNFFSWFKQFVFEPIYDLSKRDSFIYIIAFVIFFKLCDAFAGNLTLPFLLEIGFTKIEIAKIVKTFGLIATLIGAFFGGILVKKIGINKSLWIAAIGQMISNFCFFYLAKIGHNENLLYLVIFAENFTGGIGDSIFVAYLSGLCNILFSATQYALLTSLTTIARSFLASFSGIIAQSFGWELFFVLSAFLALPSFVLLFLIQKKQIFNYD